MKTAQSKIEVLQREESKAVCIYSAAKYPGQAHKPYESAVEVSKDVLAVKPSQGAKIRSSRAAPRNIHSLDIRYVGFPFLVFENSQRYSTQSDPILKSLRISKSLEMEEALLIFMKAN